MADRSRPASDDPVRGLDALSTMLESASQVIGELARDPLLKRMLAAFRAIPRDEREQILSILERDVALRRADDDGSAALMGMRNVRPNPSARLYIRVLESDTGDVPYLGIEELILAITRAARVTHRVMQTTPGIDDTWRETVMATFEALPREELEAVAWCMRMALRLVEQIDAARNGRPT